MRLLYIHGKAIDSESANVIQVINMCQAFARSGLYVTLAIAEPQKRVVDPYMAAAALLGEPPIFKITTYKNYTIAGRLNILGKYFGVRNILRSVETDLCFVRDPLSLYMALQVNKPTIFESHNYRLHNRSNWLAKLWEKKVLALANNPNLLRFITISQALAKFWLKKGVAEHKIMVLHDGFNPQHFKETKTQEQARLEVGLPPNSKIVVYAGRLGADRNSEQLINLAQECPDGYFVILGGPDKQRTLLENLSIERGVQNIMWKGHMPHAAVADYLFAADVLLMLWSWDVPHVEFFSPLKMFEYMAAGRIIVGHAFPTIGEVLTDGDTAYLADPDSFHDLCHKTQQALSLSYPSAMASKARDLALQEYSWDKRVRNLLTNLNI